MLAEHLERNLLIRLLLIIAFLNYLPVTGQTSTYQLSKWDRLDQSIKISFASSNIHFAKDKIPLESAITTWMVKAWRGEEVNTQVLIWSAASIPVISYRITDLKNSKGGIIKADNVGLSFLRYVWTDGYFGNGCGKRITSALDSSLVADIIDTVSVVSLNANTVQPCWLKINIPREAASGIYSGKLIVNAGKAFELKISIDVASHVLPAPSRWTFDLDLWQYALPIAEVHRVPLWSDDHYKAMKPYFTLLAGAGQKTITISLIEGGLQEKEVSPAMVKWIKQKDGGWRYDYSIFDKYIEFMMGCGISKRINCYTMVPWSVDYLTYYDEAIQKDTNITVAPFTPAYNLYWQTMLKDFKRHLKEKNWFTITSIAMDERKIEDMLEVIKLIRQTDPEWKISLAGSYFKELVTQLDDYSLFRSFSFTEKELAFRNAHKMASTFYTSCMGERPNMFTFSPPAESAWMGWFAAAKGFTGYLRWAYNYWNKNPLRDSRSVFPAGDKFLIYPGPLSSVRFEKLKEGIQDFEKIRVIRDTYSRNGKTNELVSLNKALSLFEVEELEQVSAEAMLDKAKAILNRY